MMKQYLSIKSEYQDHFLFYRLGDFYEMFFDDAKNASALLGLTLTGRECGEAERAPMCGVPYHSAETYIGQLVERGYKVAICEQMEEAAAGKGPVRREVIRVITPGTVIESDLLPDSRNNYLAAIYFGDLSIGVCFADISTGKVRATYFAGICAEEELLGELATIGPAEVITNAELGRHSGLHSFLQERGIPCTDKLQTYFAPEAAAEWYTEIAGTYGKGQESFQPAMYACGAAFGYIADMQKTDLSYIEDITFYENAQYLEMDTSTRRNLELMETMLDKEKKGSLLGVLDKTNTSMGRRLIRSYLEHPLRDVKKIVTRQQSVGELVSNHMLRDELRHLLASVLDMERILTRILYGTGGARELRALAQSIEVLPQIKTLLQAAESKQLAAIWENIDSLFDVYELLSKAINDTPPFSIREGGMIRDGYDSSVDELRSIQNNAKDYIKRLEEKEREATGIKNLRIGVNRVFGYYIEVTRSYSELVPPHYIRKQTLTNCERYISEELKELESTILGAEDKLKNLEYQLFCEVRDVVVKNASRVRRSGAAVAELDVYASLAQVAAQNQYVCPEVDYSDVLIIKDGRHPVVEQFVQDSYFVPNDVQLDTDENRLMLITGPNMAGKSTYMRQTALIVLMAQIGSFVPASDAHVGIVDRLFTRVGASDDLASGQSTFMLEMREVASILQHATKKSLIIYDEIGRGTSTFDGMSIARAVLEYTAGKKLGAKTLFATHYHELTELEGQIPGVVNYNIAVKKRGDDLTFLRKIVRGPVDESYGIQVAKLAGVPDEVVEHAKKILVGLEEKQERISIEKAPETMESDNTVEATPISMMDMCRESVCESIRKTDLNTLTPIEAMNLIYEWKRTIE
ncbi:MAG: DNA mismatch repair protein MutS [Clostridiales bacterium]|nr:DNA mismatch repair protein MutS [Clostridiales bacterium]